jgi:hypothetical protein
VSTDNESGKDQPSEETQETLAPKEDEIAKRSPPSPPSPRSHTGETKNDEATHVSTLIVKHCPLCDKEHRYSLTLKGPGSELPTESVLIEEKKTEESTIIVTCPVKNTKYEAKVPSAHLVLSRIDVDEGKAEPLSPQDSVLCEVGDAMVKGSMETGRDFCKTMITLTTGSIPIYFALLGFLLPRVATLPAYWLLLFMVPPVLFLIAAMIFLLGYLPKKHDVSLIELETVKKTYIDTVNRRRNLMIAGAAFFLIGYIITIIYLLALIIPL